MLPIVEISDLVVDWDGDGRRRPVERAAAVERALSAGDRRAAAHIGRLPTDEDGILDEATVDRALLRSHVELARLTEEFRHGHRAAALLRPVVDAVREVMGTRTVRVVDVGCGLGHVVRWLAAHGGLGRDVSLTGVDLDGTLVGHAAALARRESLPCRFVHGDALTTGAGDVATSTALLHHLDRDELHELLAGQRAAGSAVVVHWDIPPSPWATAGSMLFHLARMTEPLARHDGVASARRAHPDEVLVDGLARTGWVPAMLDRATDRSPMFNILRPAIGFVDRRLAAAVAVRLGRSASRLWVAS